MITIIFQQSLYHKLPEIYLSTSQNYIPCENEEKKRKVNTIMLSLVTSSSVDSKPIVSTCSVTVMN